MLTVRLILPFEYETRARYALQILAERWGTALTFLQRDEPCLADLTYGQSSSDGGFVVPFDPALYAPETPCAVLQDGAFNLWLHAGESLECADTIGGIYRLLTHLDESTVLSQDRNRRGIFKLSALPPERRKSAAVPLVEHHADWLKQKILQQSPHLSDQFVERYPTGKRWAVCLTHDVDALHLGSPAEVLAYLLKAVVRRRPVYGQMVRDGLRWLGRKNLPRNPFFGFPVWAQLEREWGIRSAFYLYYRPAGTPYRWNDCKSSVADRGMDWTLLHDLAGQGWEFSAQASLAARFTSDGFDKLRSGLEKQLTQPVTGLRHHYFALNWNDPVETFRQHCKAGFQYDSSITWQDAGGFRAGTCLPYAPFDPAADRPLEFWELPLTVMDGHVLRGMRCREEAVEKGRALLSAVRSAGGILVLDWHVEAACNQYLYTGAVDVLSEILQPALADSSAWFATPGDVLAHWQSRKMV